MTAAVDTPALLDIEPPPGLERKSHKVQQAFWLFLKDPTLTWKGAGRDHGLQSESSRNDGECDGVV